MGFASFREQVDRLTFREQRVIIIFVQRTFKKLTAFSLLFLFTLGVWCVSFATPGSLAMAAQRNGFYPGCTQNGSALEKMDCDQPNFMCSFPAPGSFSDIALASVRNHDFSKDAQCPIGWVVPVGSSDETSLAANNLGVAFRIHPAQKVSINLFNSVLTL